MKDITLAFPEDDMFFDPLDENDYPPPEPAARVHNRLTALERHTLPGSRRQTARILPTEKQPLRLDLGALPQELRQAVITTFQENAPSDYDLTSSEKHFQAVNAAQQLQATFTPLQVNVSVQSKL